MGRLTIQCKNPKCKRRFSSGVEMEMKDFEDATNVTLYTRCPYCGRQGRYNRSDLKFEE